MPLYAILSFVFVATAFVLFFIFYLFVPSKSVLEERIDALRASEEGGEVSSLLRPTPAGWQSFLARLGRRMPLRPHEYGRYRKTIVSAGYRREVLPIFIGAKIFLALLFAGVYFVFYGLPVENDPRMILLSVIILGIIGFLLPTYWLSNKVKKRRIQIFHDLPDVLDLMTVCVEAGLSMESAMLRISQDRQFAKSPLAQEMKICIQESRAGKPRHEALKDMADRIGESDVKAFSAMLIQTERLGTSLAESLRVHSDSLRIRRRQLAEERAAKTAIKLLFPLVFLLLPSMFVVIGVPAMIRIMRVFAEM